MINEITPNLIMVWLFFCVYTAMPSPNSIRLKEPAIAGYVYNPSKPPFEKGGFFVALWATLLSQVWTRETKKL